MEEIGFGGAMDRPVRREGPTLSEWGDAMERMRFALLKAEKERDWARYRFQLRPLQRRYDAGERGWALFRKVMEVCG